MSARAPDGTGLFINGQRDSGSEVRTGNITSAIAVSNIVKSSLGPVGLDKMLVDDIGDLVITNDGATILSQLEVEHPAARVLVDLAELQDKEVGDGTTSVVIIAAELLRRGNALVKNGFHPTTIISGYRSALKASVAYLKKYMVMKVSELEDEHLINAAKTSISSKIIGKEADFFAKLVVDAVKSVEIRFPIKLNTSNTDLNDNLNKRTRVKYPLSSIHILKAHGRSSLDSHLLDGGFAINATRAAQGMPTAVEMIDGQFVKVAMLDMNLQRHRMAMGVQILVKDPVEVENIKKREMDITKERIAKIIDAGVRVVLTTKGVDDLCMKYFVEAGIICSRRVNKDDLKRLAKATGGKVIVTMADMEGNESIDPECLGSCTYVREECIGDGEMLYFHGCHGAVSTIVLRGANEYMLDEMDRALHDSLSVVKRMLESNTLVVGGGAVEAALSVYLDNYASSLDNREQVVIEEFANALLIIPKTLAVNAAKDSSDLIAKMRSAHSQFQSSHNHEENLQNTGLDLIEGNIRENLSAGVVEPAISKIKCFRFATEAAITILRIDDRIILDRMHK